MAAERQREAQQAGRLPGMPSVSLLVGTALGLDCATLAHASSPASGLTGAARSHGGHSAARKLQPTQLSLEVQGGALVIPGQLNASPTSTEKRGVFRAHSPEHALAHARDVQSAAQPDAKASAPRGAPIRGDKDAHHIPPWKPRITCLPAAQIPELDGSPVQAHRSESVERGASAEHAVRIPWTASRPVVPTIAPKASSVPCSPEPGHSAQRLHRDSREPTHAAALDKAEARKQREPTAPHSHHLGHRRHGADGQHTHSRNVSPVHPGRLVLGSEQALELGATSAGKASPGPFSGECGAATVLWQSFATVARLAEQAHEHDDSLSRMHVLLPCNF